ncbi:MAG: efflux RND transporter periplasmic adaptor subunit [Candidatus Saccharicenans sp.]|jgi:HlyD family secretion protein|nr:efflux RND transporter periplasmic adaptor subunit [Candidatus Saccharicenans sp.]
MKALKSRDKKPPVVFVCIFFMVLFSLILVMTPGCRKGAENNLIRVTGTIESRTARISPRVSGRVLRLLVEEGQAVKPGQLLVELDHEYLDLQLRQAEAAVAAARAQLELLKRGARSEDISQAEQQLKQAEINLEQARNDAGRFRRLYEQGSITQKQKEEAENRLALAEAQYNQAQEALKKIKSFARPEEIEAAEARLRQAEAAADLLKKNIEDSKVICPVEGVVTEKAVEPGELVNPGTPLVSISCLDPVYLWVYVTAEELGRVKLGGWAEVTIDSFPGKVFEGKVVYISPEAEFTPKNIQTREDRVKLVFAVKIELPNPEGQLKPGLPAEAVIRAE